MSLLKSAQRPTKTTIERVTIAEDALLRWFSSASTEKHQSTDTHAHETNRHTTKKKRQHTIRWSLGNQKYPSDRVYSYSVCSQRAGARNTGAAERTDSAKGRMIGQKEKEKEQYNVIRITYFSFESNANARTQRRA